MSEQPEIRTPPILATRTRQRATRTEQRTVFAERRRHGLQARHATKLARTR